jgi:hypothetical protein
MTRSGMPEPVAWLIRYHSINPERCALYMDARDCDYTARSLEAFKRYDQGTKSVFVLPDRRVLERHRELIEKTFPKPILV